jgi:thioredoxin 1
LKVVKINTDENFEWAMKFGVQGIPTMLFIKDGQVVRFQVGALPEHALRELTKELLEAVPEQPIH